MNIVLEMEEHDESMLGRRSRNLLIQQQFLESLNIPSLNKEERSSLIKKNCNLQLDSELSPSNISNMSAYVQVTVQLLNQFEFRDLVLRSTLSYLSNEVHVSKPLLLIGHSGSGKSLIISSIIKLKLKHQLTILVNCNCFSNSIQLLRFLWSSLVEQLINFDSKFSSSLKLDELKIRSYEDFRLNIYHVISICGNLNFTLKITFLIDDIDCLESVESGLSWKLLMLCCGKDISSLIKIIATSTLFHANYSIARSLFLEDYSDVQIEKIINNKIINTSGSLFTHFKKYCATENILCDIMGELFRIAFPKLIYYSKHIGYLWKSFIHILKIFFENSEQFLDESYKLSKNTIIRIIDDYIDMGSIVIVRSKISDSHVNSLSLTLKYLVLSGFICSMNSASEDISRFAGLRNLKRKRDSLSNDDATSMIKNEATWAFTLERAFSAFMSMVSQYETGFSIGKYNSNTIKDINDLYCDTFLFSQVKALENKGIWKLTNSNSKHALYRSTISQTIAEEIAKTIGPKFDLNVYINR